jgi:hypothetical protein
MKRRSLLVPLITVALAGCASHRATTAEDFVKKHAKAYYFRDAKAVAAMTLCAEDLDQTAIPERIKQELKEHKRDSLLSGLKDEMKQEGDMWVKAWESTKYERELDHGDHIHVDVTVGYARNSIVLARVGKELKIAPNPSAFE